MIISGNTILITGGAGGIGLALTQMFMELENKVIIVGRNMGRLNAVQQEHPQVAIIRADLSQQSDLEKVLMTVQQQHPETNILINNAAVQHNYELTSESLPYERIDQEIGVNFTAIAKLCTMLLPQLCAQKEAAIVNVSSGLAFVPKQNAAVYCATKAAVHNFSKVLRYQLEDTPVKVFELIPPLVDTEMTAGRGQEKLSPEMVAEALKKALLNNQFEISVGKVKLLRFMARWLPSMIEKKLRYSE